MTVLVDNLEGQVAEILTRYSMLAPGDRVGVAVSGGGDSVALLHLLHRLKFKVVVLHVNHGLRGAESEADELFVRELAERFGVPVEVAKAPVGEGNVEQEAREGRRRFFLEAKDRLKLNRVALGHNKSDQAETVLYRFLRGSGLAGIAGMKPVTAEGLIRPLLTFSRTEIRDWARAEGISWREDTSNADPEFARNRLRQETIPALAKTFNPNLEAVLANNAKVAQAEEEWWDLRIEASFGQIAKRNGLGSYFQIPDFEALHPAEQRRFLRRAVQEIKGDRRSIDLQHIEAIRKLMSSKAGHDRVLIPGIDVVRSFDTVLLTKLGVMASLPRHYRVPVKMGEEANLPFGLGRLYVYSVKPGLIICANFGDVDNRQLESWELDEDVLFQATSSEMLMARNWEPGDEMARRVGGKPEKLKLLFQEFRVLLWERRNWPVLTSNEGIVWSRRFGCAAKFKANSASRNTVRLFYEAAPVGGNG